MKTFAAVMLMATAAFGEYREVVKKCVVDESIYQITFTFDDAKPTFPAKSDVPHYAANIDVKVLRDGNWQWVGEPFRGVFTDEKCWEDVPENLIRVATEMTWTRWRSP